MTMASYDHERTITAFFDTRAAADKAKTDLVAAGIPTDRVSIVQGQGTTATSASSTEGGFWQSLKDMFVSDQDRTVYAEGLKRGGFLLSAESSTMHYERVLDILDKDGAVDMNERETQWRSEGWTGTHATGVAGAGALGSVAAYGGGAHDTMATQPLSVRSATTTTGVGTGVGAKTGAAVGADEVIPIAEESLRVGKRDVSHGRVRLRSYVVEKPVNESIDLHSERVDVSRRPVDRVLGAAEDPFRERTIEAEEHEEEAVVSKDVRIVEEVTLSRVAQNRTEEIHDTVRRTEVETDDGRNVAGRATGLMGTSATATSWHDRVAEHMPVFATDGTRVGTVDHLDGERIKLAKNDSPDGQHHFIPLSWVSKVDDGVRLGKGGDEVRSGWATI